MDQVHERVSGVNFIQVEPVFHGPLYRTQTSMILRVMLPGLPACKPCLLTEWSDPLPVSYDHCCLHLCIKLNIIFMYVIPYHTDAYQGFILPLIPLQLLRKYNTVTAKKKRYHFGSIPPHPDGVMSLTAIHSISIPHTRAYNW